MIPRSSVSIVTNVTNITNVTNVTTGRERTETRVTLGIFGTLATLETTDALKVDPPCRRRSDTYVRCEISRPGPRQPQRGPALPISDVGRAVGCDCPTHSIRGRP